MFWDRRRFQAQVKSNTARKEVKHHMNQNTASKAQFSITLNHAVNGGMDM